MYKPAFASLLSVLICFVFVGESYAAKTYRLPNGELLNDPTFPSGWNVSKRPKANAQSFKLNYILNADSRKQAMVNGKKVRVGDTVSGAQVVLIQKDTVTLLVDGHSRILRMNKKLGIKQTN